MKFVIEKKTIFKSLTHLQSIVDKRNVLPILSNILIEAKNNEISMSSTDMDISIKEMDVYNKFAKAVTDAIRRQLENVGGKLNGHPDRRLAHNLNMRFDGIESKAIINSVSKKVAISAGSACTTDVVEPSHVLLAIGLNEEQSHQSIRIGLSRFTSDTEAMVAAEEICDAIEELKKIRA